LTNKFIENLIYLMSQ